MNKIVLFNVFLLFVLSYYLQANNTPAFAAIEETILLEETIDCASEDSEEMVVVPISPPTDATPCVATSGCIGGHVFEDFNCNGINDTNEPSVEGIVVKIYDGTNTLVDSLYSDSEGDWQLCNLTDGAAYRVEFTLPVAIALWATPTHTGSDNGSDVQFLTVPACTQFSVSNPVDYCEDNPRLGISCFLNGSGVGNTRDGFVTFDYDAHQTGEGSGIPDQFLSGTNVQDPSKDAQVQEIGAVWGGAWQRKTERVFLSAFTKRHVGFGPRGIDGVYVLDYSGVTPTVAGGFDVQGITTTNGGTIDVGTVQRTAVVGSISGDDELSDGTTTPNIDLFAFDAVGKTSFGDLELGEDEETLWLVNLKQKALIKVDLSNYTPSMTNPTVLNSTVVDQYLLSNMPNMPSCNDGELRPWGLKMYRGRAYLGLICDAATVENPADLTAFVVSFDPNAPYSGVTVELTFGMDYTRENTDNPGLSGFWAPWISDWSQVDDSNERQHPQPILSNIDFTDEGNMVIGVMDRFGNQMGVENYIPVSGTSTLSYLVVFATGDILHACNNGLGGWTLEGTGGCSTLDTGVANTLTNDGPSGNGEYYFNDYFDRANPTPDGDYNHAEISTGSVVVVKGKNTVVNTVWDPVTDNRLFREGTFTQGVHYYNTTTAAKTAAYMLVDRTDVIEIEEFSKANGLGELFAFCAPAPLEVGNYVWCDSIQNGIQDAGEKGVDNLLVQLYDDNGVIVGQTVTANGGQYYFNENNVDLTGISVDGNDVVTPNTSWSGLDYNSSYFIVFGNGQFSAGEFTVGGKTYTGTTTVDVNNNNNDNIDSDVDGSSLTTGSLGTRPDGLPYIAFTTDAQGCGDHRYDMGVTCTIPVEVSLTKTVDQTQVTLNNNVVFTITVYNEGVAVTGATVIDVLPNGFQYVGDDTNNAYNNNTGIWTIGNMAAGDSAKMQLTVKLIDDQVLTLTNEAFVIINETETDTTNNEDKACVSVPIEICDDGSQSIDATAFDVNGDGSTTYRWYISADNGATYDSIPANNGGTAQTYNITQAGYYVYLVNDGTLGDCSNQTCCPIIVTTMGCIICPTKKCIPVQIQKNN